eukprot:6369819-Alexandrium_andersonii.AAC.1
MAEQRVVLRAAQVDPFGLAGRTLAALAERWRAERRQLADLAASGAIAADVPGLVALTGPLVVPPVPGGSYEVAQPPPDAGGRPAAAGQGGPPGGT